jgi:cytochrome c-type biogenesis protein CcmH/NrfF
MTGRRSSRHVGPPNASDIKASIRKGLAEGATAAEIKAAVVDELGPDALSIAPRRKRLLLAMGLLLAGAALVGTVRRSRRRRAALPQDGASGGLPSLS